MLSDLRLMLDAVDLLVNLRLCFCKVVVFNEATSND